MDSIIATSSMSASLLARNVYWVCFSQRDSLDSLRGEFAAARKKFFTQGKKAVKVGKNEIVKGFDGKLQGKLTRRTMYWKKSANKIALEEAFDQKNGHVLVARDFRGVIVSRTFFDREMIWTKSEYYEPWDSGNARVIFKPSDVADMVERFDWDGEKKRYRSVQLYPVPYLPGTSEQSILNARFGEPMLVISTGDGDFCYCPEKEADARKRALTEINDGTIVLMPAWEIKDGALAGEEGEEASGITFTSLEEYARIEVQEADEPAAEEAREAFSSSAMHTEGEKEFTPAQEEEQAAENEDAAEEAPEEETAPLAHEEEAPLTEEEEILAAARRSASQTENAAETEKNQPVGMAGYRGDIRDGKITGRGRTEQQNGLTAYDGEYFDGKREGFGSYYYKDGNLCYAGFWKDDKKDGLGVSFRDSDHALHIANWVQGQPGGLVSLFDKDGNLRYGGRIEDGKKQGAGVTINGEDGTVFVGKWIDGEATGTGAAFDREGNLLYSGEWKDGKRNGHGTEFDKNGGIVFDGEWKDDKYQNGILYQKLAQDNLNDPDAMGPSWDL